MSFLNRLHPKSNFLAIKIPLDFLVASPIPMIVTHLVRLSCVSAFTLACCSVGYAKPATPAAPATADLVVYGTTPAGVALAVRAAREGRTVVLIGHAKRIGGMFSYGLGAVDSHYQGPRSPFFDELIARVHTHYRDTYGVNSSQYKSSGPNTAGARIEPRVAERLFGEFVAHEPRITLHQGWYPVAATREEALVRTVAFRAMDGAGEMTFSARIFADCSYEGDLAAVVGAPYRVGRESREEFGEEHAGRIFVRAVPWPPPGLAADYIKRYRQLNIKRIDYWSEIIRPQSTGEADSSVQAYSIRFLLSADPANSVPITKPQGYDRDALLARIQPSSYHLSQFRDHHQVPNNKRFINQAEIIGAQNRYVEGTWAERRQVIAEHRALIHELLYFYQNDPSLPADVRAGWSKLGLPRDEFTDSGHLPDEIYVREARRIIGRATVTENNFRLAPGAGRAPVVPDSIGVSEWFLDSHACAPERVEGSLWEGEFYLFNKTWPGQVPVGSLLPQGVDNLLVPVCLGATHVGFGSVRVEPVWMSLAESAAHLALLALERKITPAQVPADTLMRRLAERKILLTFFNDIAPHLHADWYPAVQYLGTKGFFGDYDAEPAAPLTEAVAERWLEAVAKLHADDAYDATAFSVQCWQAEKTTSPPIGREKFAAQLAQSLGSSAIGGSDTAAGISRGEACRMIYSALARR